ncbi:hypothetical protein Hanom_Chr16g01448461 [Helianthus anomalus]
MVSSGSVLQNYDDYGFRLQRLVGCSQTGKWAQKVIRGIVYISCWVIWKLRNAKVFQDSTPKVVEALALIKSWSFLWLKSRSKFSSLEWKEWTRNPLYML